MELPYSTGQQWDLYVEGARMTELFDFYEDNQFKGVAETIIDN